MKKKILFIACLLFGLMFINAGLNKFLNYMPVPKDMPPNAMAMFGAIMQIKWLMPLIGIAEIIGGILVIIPRFRALGAVIIFPVMVGILLTVISLSSGIPMVLVLWAVLIWVLFENREKYFHMIR
ncbi:DoxX family membrane protein [Mucilaginibacter rubeus]|uniref:DoxX family membrane protein n=1 Tax=Mucilaginibacter rubeus TaxID=2027860 RepID=A0AAE6JD67_9SPHI|nr:MULTISPECIES: DoxX family membrane protein [Mucilaginibacter]QEM03509.1 DoxX family membrane protein [Mucilaginibacter rubeus]QEM16124.1 DoxX family membrane protein [Mucilaginibacter gossypii]QTE38946.1 DoxX family membrane protein [Mucilaginibacter gossypii]QTE41125.1 DoxX family membrane protein [Mucilaginibacter rubeus]QTE47728.1 DoxX family membrane protein [Mucilaginibacter rubeus]